MTTHEYLSAIRLYGQRVGRSLEEIARLEEMAKSTAAPPYDRERVQTSAKGDGLCQNIAKMIDIEREDYLNFSFKRKEIIRQIEQIHEPAREILLRKYVDGQNITAIANTMSISYRHVCRLYKSGMETFAETFGYLYQGITYQSLTE